MLPNFTIMQGIGNIFDHNKQTKKKFGDKILWSILVNAIQVKVTLWVCPYIPLNLQGL